MQIHPLAPEDSMALLRRALASQCARKDAAYDDQRNEDGVEKNGAYGAKKSSSSSRGRRHSNLNPPVMVDSSPGLFAAVIQDAGLEQRKKWTRK